MKELQEIFLIMQPQKYVLESKQWVWVVKIIGAGNRPQKLTDLFSRWKSSGRRRGKQNSCSFSSDIGGKIANLNFKAADLAKGHFIKTALIGLHTIGGAE